VQCLYYVTKKCASC